MNYSSVSNEMLKRSFSLLFNLLELIEFGECMKYYVNHRFYWLISELAPWWMQLVPLSEDWRNLLLLLKWARKLHLSSTSHKVLYRRKKGERGRKTQKVRRHKIEKRAKKVTFKMCYDLASLKLCGRLFQSQDNSSKSLITFSFQLWPCYSQVIY